jgi:hypothetical protein
VLRGFVLFATIAATVLAYLWRELERASSKAAVKGASRWLGNVWVNDAATLLASVLMMLPAAWLLPEFLSP